MGQIKEQLLKIYGGISMPVKIISVAILLGLMLSFGFMIYWANQPVYKVLYANMTPEEASQVVDKLDEMNILYQLTANGTTIKIPEKDVYNTRIRLAGEGIPKGGKDGYEILDEEQFGSTQFQQQINYQRAKQGELARTIMKLDQVENAKVMIVMAKESVFLEESKPATASVLLKLNSNLPKSKVKAVVHLVASAVEDLTPERVTVIDTNGNVLSDGNADENSVEMAANTQLNYRMSLERNYTERIQSMLEKIVGQGKAIVRVTADLDFNQVDQSEEIFDPETHVTRSQHTIDESADKKTFPVSDISSVNPIAGNENTQLESTEKSQKKNEILNYEINKTVRRTVKPLATIQRLSVAAVLDGKYVDDINDQGQRIKKYIPRTAEEIAGYDRIVRQAMGYSEDREDQVTVESFQFSYADIMPDVVVKSLPQKIADTIHMFRFPLVILLVVLCIVLPLLKAMKEIKTTVIESALPPPEESQGLLTADGKEALPDPSTMPPKQKAIHLANEDMEKTTNIIRAWMTEAEA